MSFVVELSPVAEADLERLFDYLLDQANTTEDLDHAQAAIDAIRAAVQHRLAITPFSFRKAAGCTGQAAARQVCAARNFGTPTPSATVSNTACTGMPIRTESGSVPTRLLINRPPSSSATIAIT